VSAEVLTLLLNIIKQVPDDETNRQYKEAKKAADKVEEAITGKSTRSQKRKRPTAEDTAEPKPIVPWVGEALELVVF
jgi:hypothetical protein